MIEAHDFFVAGFVPLCNSTRISAIVLERPLLDFPESKGSLRPAPIKKEKREAEKESAVRNLGKPTNINRPLIKQ